MKRIDALFNEIISNPKLKSTQSIFNIIGKVKMRSFLCIVLYSQIFVFFINILL